MKIAVVMVASLSLGLWACEAENDTAEGTRTVTSALVTVEGGSPGQDSEFVVEIEHGDDVSEGDAFRLAKNIRVRPADIRVRAEVGLNNPGHIRPADLHWMVPDDHDVVVQVIPVDPESEDAYQWHWANDEIVLGHCPPGHVATH